MPVLLLPQSDASGAINLTLTPATVTLSAVALTRDVGGVTATLSPATVTTSAVALTVTPGTAAVTLTPATVTTSAVGLAISAGASPQTVDLTPATVTVEAVALTIESAAEQTPAGGGGRPAGTWRPSHRRPCRRRVVVHVAARRQVEMPGRSVRCRFHEPQVAVRPQRCVVRTVRRHGPQVRCETRGEKLMTDEAREWVRSRNEQITRFLALHATADQLLPRR